jgi:ABC-2 type transport system permease protein
MLGWIIGPVFSGGGDETLRPEFFSLLGLRPQRMAAGLLVAAFVGVAPAVSLLALAGLVAAGVREGVAGALVAVPAMVLQLAVFVLLSKVSVALMGLALGSRIGAIGAGVVNGVILAFLGQIWVFMAAFGQGGQIPEVVRYLPSGWGLLAVQGEYLALAAMAVLVVLLLVAWAALLTRRAGRSRPSTRGRRPMRAGTPHGAVVAKELRSWTRDLVRNHQLAFAFTYGVAFAAVPLMLGIEEMLPLAAPLFIMMAAAMTANVYGTDGTAHWLTLMTPGASDVRGRQLAWLAAVGPVGLALAVICTAVVDGPWPLVMAATFALLGGAVGLVPLVSVAGLIPGIDPKNRGGNPLRTSEDDGSATGMAYLMLALVALTAAPAVAVAVFFGWWGVPAGLLSGALCWWGFGLLAERRLTARGPELLHLMRTGRAPESGKAASGTFQLPESMSRTQRMIVLICASFGAIPLVPQGIVAMVFLTNGQLQHSWFLATHVSPGLRWPVAIGFVLLGLGMYGTALWLWLRARKAEKPAGDVTDADKLAAQHH